MGDDIAIFVSDEQVISGLASESVEYLAWVAEGNTAEQWQPEQPITEEPMVEDAN